MIRVSAFKWVPPMVRGLVRDLRIRWALEEAGLPHEIALIDRDDQQSADYRAWQPFGQVPAYEERHGDGAPLRLFESGAIVLHIAERPDAGDTLLPADPAGRARAVQWLFAALNSIEPQLLNLVAIDLFYANEEWARARRPDAEAMVTSRLAELAKALGDQDWLADDRFTAGDLMMATVLRLLRHTDLVAAQPNLAAYLVRCQERPAFGRALEAQMATFGD